jgi:hypothetical protein
MKKLVLAAVATLAVSSAHATQKSDLLCKLTDTQGSTLLYSFNNNTSNVDGSIGGTFVETGFQKNGHSVFAPVGARPIWIFFANQIGGLTIQSRNDAGWSLVQGAIGVKGNVYSASTALYHGARVVASGWCGREGAVTAATVNDQGL